MQINNLSENNSILNQFVAEIRDVDVQKDRMRFRRNIERLGEIFAYEISKQLEYEKKEVITSLGKSKTSVLKNQPVLATILRAGIPFHNGFLNYFDKAGNAFVSAYRKYTSENDFFIQLDYVSTPKLDGKILIIADPMLATALSLIGAYRELLKNGKPKHTHLGVIIATISGIEYLQKELKGENITLWTAAIDKKLNSKSYIVPGLGDAGDLEYGNKL